MDTPVKNSSTLSDTLETRKAHLHTLLNVIDMRSGKITEVQKLSKKAIESEITLIEKKTK